MARLGVHEILSNRTRFNQSSSIEIVAGQWIHLAWTYSNEKDQTDFYLDGARQQWIDFGAMSLDFESK